MFDLRGTTSILSLAFALLFAPSPLASQTTKAIPATNAGPSVTTEKAIALAGQGHCQEAISALKRAVNAQGSAETRKEAGVLGLRCSLAMDNHEVSLDFARALSKQFPQDPDILFILVHAYSDLSTRAAQDLGRFAPDSIPAHKLNAEALEMQGKWGEAQREYEGMIEKAPNQAGIHYLYGRLLLSRPDADDKAAEQAKQQFQKELEIDPNNAGAHYILGELDSKAEQWDDAIAQFSQAAKLDPSFAEAFLGWGFALVTVKRYAEAIPPLRVAEKLTPGNPAVHYSLATALTRTGQKEEGEKEFAIHRSLTSNPSAVAPIDKPQ